MTKFKEISRFIFLFFLIFFSGCKKNKINHLNKLNRAQNYLKNNLFKLFIDNIECKSCAKNAIKVIEKNNVGSKVEFICPNLNFENYYINLYVDKNKTIDFEKMRKDLKEEGFNLNSACGEFVGSYFVKDKKTFFKLENSNIQAKVKYEINKSLKFNQSLVAKGKLDFFNKEHVFYLNS